MKIKHLVIAGGSGLIGDALVNHFKGQADRITILTCFPKHHFLESMKCLGYCF